MKDLRGNQHTIYFDISEFLSTRFTTGIQRVIKEFLVRAINNNIPIKVVYFDSSLNNFQHLPNNEVNLFLKNIKEYKIDKAIYIDLFILNDEKKILFDMDSIWNAPMKREYLYPKLKKYNFKIYNFIYDLIPVIYPDYFYDKAKENFTPFLNAVFAYSDLVFLDSYSSRDDFENIKAKGEFTNKISTNIVYPGSDFLSDKGINHHKYDKILSSKFILFVGTIEPRKCQAQVLEAFEELHNLYPKLNLVLIGRVGWQMDEFVNSLKNHSLINKNIFHLQNIDDKMLSNFYKNAFVVTYLSRYEGYGLPVAESLTYGNITITSKNSSLLEVGKEFADYIEKYTKKELVGIISKYIEDKNIYEQRKTYIKTKYTPITWDDFYDNMIGLLEEKENDRNK